MPGHFSDAFADPKLAVISLILSAIVIKITNIWCEMTCFLLERASYGQIGNSDIYYGRYLVRNGRF